MSMVPWWCVFFYISGCHSHLYKYGRSWNGYDFHTYPHPAKKTVVPRDMMVDVINNLGLKLLAIHNEYNENNIAISPYGALSVLVALGEGLQGSAAFEIQNAAHLPNDISIIRVGLRDIHRHLKSYFIPKEGFLAGLTLNHENVSLRPQYEDILRFYGYDTVSFNNALFPLPETTEKPETTVRGEVTTTTEQATTETVDSTGMGRTAGEQPGEETTTVQTTTRLTTDAVTTTQITTTETEKPVTTVTPETTTFKVTTEMTATTVDLATNTSLPDTFVTEEITVEPTTTKLTTTEVMITQGTTTQQPTEETTVKVEVTLPSVTTESVPETTVVTLRTTSEESTTTTVSVTEAMTTQATVEESSTPFNVKDITTEVSTVVDISTPTPGTTTNTPTSTLTIVQNDPTTLLPLTTSSTTLPVTTEVFTSTESPDEESTLPTIETTSILIPSATTDSSSETTDTETTESEFTSTETSDISTITDSKVNEIDATDSSVENVGFGGAVKRRARAGGITAKNNVVQLNMREDTENKDKNFKRNGRSVVDYLLARYYDDHYFLRHRHHRPYIPKEELSFLVYGKYREYNINFMKYDTVLPFYYIPHLDTLALSFPLDSSKYYLLLLLPIEETGIDKLVCDLRLNGSLKYIIANLRYTHVVATIPSFTLKGYVTLTPSFQKLGIRKVFEPRQADFTPMTNQSQIYVTNIEQAITVTIRNYVDPDTTHNYRNLHQYDPVHFKADHPFLYFVIDTEIHVTLMAGKIVNPLNSRIS